MTDLACSLALFVGALAMAVAYGGRISRARGGRHERVERDGGSAWLGKGAMEMGYRALQPLGRACVALGIGANPLSYASLAFAAGAGVALALGHFGVGAALGVASSVCDALDGYVARETKTASDAGEVLDATVDRYAELLFLGGVAVDLRGDPLALSVVLAASAASVMVSYATAKAEAMGVEVARGSMRRAERAVYLTTGTALVPIVAAMSSRWNAPGWAAQAPLLTALMLVAIVGNVSAVRRLQAVAHALRAPIGSSAFDSGTRSLPREGHAGAGNPAQ